MAAAAAKELIETPAGEEIQMLDPVELEVELPAGEPEPDGGATPKPDPTKPEPEDPVVAKLRSDLAATQQRESLKDQELARVSEALQNTRTQVQETEVGRYDAAIEAAGAKASQLERELADAYITADYAKVASIQRQIAKAESQIGLLEQTRDILKKREVEIQQPTADTVEGVIAANPALPTRDRDWLRAHPDAITDPAKFERLQSTAAFATQKFGGQTDAYYAFIEQELGYKTAQPDQKPQPAARKQPQVAAPVSRETSSGIGHEGARTGSKVRLSPAQRQAAKDSGVTDAEYAKNLIGLVKSGQLPATAVEYVS